MKLFLLNFIAAILVGTSFQSSESGSSSSSEEKGASLDSLKQHVSLLTSFALKPVSRQSKQQSRQQPLPSENSSTASFIYAWDTMSIKTRFYLLNQNQMGMKQNLTPVFDYKWASLRGDVQEKLIAQKNKVNLYCR